MVKNPSTNAGDIETQVRSLDQNDPLEEDMATHSSILPGEPQGQRSLEGCDPWGCKESDRTSDPACTVFL